MSKSNESLADRLIKAEVYEEFCALMFGQRTRYEDLLETLEKWGISSSLGGLHRFSESHRSLWTLERAKRMAAQELNNEELDEAQRKVVAERLFNLAASPDITDKTLLKMRDQEIASVKLKQDAVKLEQAEKKLDQAEKKLDQAQELIDLQKRKIEALEAQAEAAARAAEKTRDALKSGGMDDSTRQTLIAEMDHLLLGRPKPKQEAAHA